jgi:hypothetical protein
MLRVRVPRHVARLVTRLIAPLVVDNSASRRLVVDYSTTRLVAPLVVDYSSSRRLVVDYIATQLVVPLVVDFSASRRLVVDYFAYAARPGDSARRAARHTAHH